MSTSQIRKTKPQSFFNLLNVVYCLGAIIVFYALINLEMFAYSSHGSHGLLYVSLSYALVLGSVGIYCWKVKKKEMIGGLAIFLCLALVPLIAYGALDVLGWSFDEGPGDYLSFNSLIKSGWLAVELFTILLTLIAIYFFRFPLFTVVLYPVLWFACCIDIFPDILSNIEAPEDVVLGEWISVVLGLVIVAIAFWKERKVKTAFVAWEYFFGMLAFWLGITFIIYESELSNALYGLINIGLIILGPVLNRTIFTAFGGIGLANYLGQLAYRFLGNTALFSVVLTIIGLAVLGLGIVLQRYMRSKSLKS